MLDGSWSGAPIRADTDLGTGLGFNDLFVTILVLGKCVGSQSSRASGLQGFKALVHEGVKVLWLQVCRP